MGDFLFLLELVSGFMLNRETVDLTSTRTLPLRNVQHIFASTNGIAIQNHVWFTPEVIILDAFSVLAKVFILWNLFIGNLPSISFRIGA